MVRSDARRNIDRILDAAIRVLADRPSSTLGEIADASGLHRATLHRHFTSRDDLVNALMARAGEEAEAAFWAARPEDGPFEDALDRVMQAAVELSDRYRVLVQIGGPDLETHRQRVAQPLLALFELGRATGALRRDVPVRWIQLAFRGVIVAAAEAIADGTLSSAQATTAAVETFHGGLAAERERASG